MSTASESTARIREKLLALRAGYRDRIDTIHAHARNPLEPDSSEQAAQLGNGRVCQPLDVGRRPGVTGELHRTAAQAREAGFVRPGQRVALMGIGSGLQCQMLALEA